ncbi:MAG: MarC family NAAT transporter [Vampirovibrionales bacterium]|nr:MarC family NAAT transporter [Vampirovibrionales bacterium]
MIISNSLFSPVNPVDLGLFFVGTLVSLFSIVDPLMAVPTFVSVTAHDTPGQRISLARRTGFFVFCILIIFFISGSLILTFFGISIDALRIAGGLMILSSAYGMLNQKSRLAPEEQQEAGEKEDHAFSPLAMPLLSGPGAIAVIIGLTADAKTFWHQLCIIGVIALISYSCYLTLRLANKVVSNISKTTINAFTRIMGFILLCVGVQFIVNGVQPILLNSLGGK